MPALRQKELVQKFLEEVKSAKDGILYCGEYINFKILQTERASDTVV